MFTNIGQKIKTLASVICWVGIVLSVIAFAVMLGIGVDYDDGLLIGLSFAALAVGALGSWIGSFFLYGYGELIDRVASIEDKLSGNGKKDDNSKEISSGEKKSDIENTLIIKDEKIDYRQYYGYNARKVIFQAETESIGISAFANCSFLTEIKLPENLKTISNDAFFACANLKEIVIPKNVETIGKRAFYGCYKLKIYCEAESKPDGWSDEWNPNDRPVVWGYKEE